MSEFKQQLWSMDMLPKDILIGKIKRLEQALEEIKEIAKSNIDCKEFIAIQCMLMGSADDKNKVLQQILQKISEVIDD